MQQDTARYEYVYYLYLQKEEKIYSIKEDDQKKEIGRKLYLHSRVETRDYAV